MLVRDIWDLWKLKNSGAIINCYADISGTGTCVLPEDITDAGIVSNSYSVRRQGRCFFNQYGTNDTAGEGQQLIHIG